MSLIEELVYSALEHGKRTDLLNEVTKLKRENPHMPLNDVYNKAYQYVMNT